MTRLFVLGMALVLTGCFGSSSDTSNNNTDNNNNGSHQGGNGGGPELHQIASAESRTYSYYYGYSFYLPKTAEVSFNVTSPHDDYYGVAIFSPAQWISFQNGTGDQAECCVYEYQSSVSGGATLGAGEWYLGFWCLNSWYDCTVAFSIDARY